MDDSKAEITAALRMQEQSRRNSLARSRALRELAKRFPDEVIRLSREYRKEIDKERGPLPGD
jgi:hypothetical protein